ncbi:hypothetical protein MAM1_0003d00319 [Mucor ambiguus]|uniref:Uncharacterized protein n=1 Tax=Mucor ambiguus TaxID=91626 RepID=A0A0C9MG09_9FUNG|nr:hypothetical protein MAM1_0003d00319 [Mucor ambiguus]
MLLSTAALEKHKGNFDMFKHQMKLDRVKSYVADQQNYIHQYKSPSSSNVGSVPESCESQEPLSSNVFSASISEIIQRKQARSDAAPSSNTHLPSHQPSSSYTQKQPLLHSSSMDRCMPKAKRPAVPDESVQEGSLVRHNKRHKLSSSSSHASDRIPLQTKPSIIKKATHGMQLLKMKSNIKQPKLGIFRKGKSSAQGRPIPDITDFHESTIENKESNKPTVVMEDLSHEPPSISKFFSKKPAQTANSTMSHTHHATTIHQYNKPKEIPHAMPVLSSNRQARKGSGSPSPAAAAGASFEAFSNNSFDSIYRLLDECQDMNQYLTCMNGHHAKPNYSHVKTPHSIFQPTATADPSKINRSNLSFFSNSKLPHPLYPSPVPRTSTPHNEPVFAQPLHSSDAYFSYYRLSQHPMRQSPPPTPAPDQKLSAPSWQVAESVASLAASTATEEHAQLHQDKADADDHTATANEDLELILQSPAMNILGESIQQNDDNIQSFWLHQPSFTTRGH